MKSFSDYEKEILEFWKSKDIFQKSVQNRKGQKVFRFNDGPPFATGLPHYGHLLASSIKDTVLRYKTMQGFYADRRFGWDCHGLPIESEIEKIFGLKGASSIEEFGIEKFNEECRKIVMRYSKEWEKTIDRIGRWVDFEKNYRTMDLPFMESVWWTFKNLFEKGLVYEGYKVMPFSTKLGTPLSNFEANSNYKEVDDPSVVVAFAVKFDPKCFFLAWTTTPWTLPSNLALTVHSEIEYAKVESGGKFYILASDLVENFFDEFVLIEKMPGSKLVGMEYEPLFDIFSNVEGAFRVIDADFVSTEDGTGIVHTAPAHGEDDFYACQKHKIEAQCIVDDNGVFEKGPFEGLYVKDADKKVIQALKEKGLLFLQKTIHHRYPFCWRTDTPLIYKVVNTWFVAVEKIKDRLIAANEEIHWMPHHIKTGRFGKWIANARDWAISRLRYWGTPIPLYKSEEGDLLAVGSIKELEELSGQKVEDLHRDKIDHLVLEKDGKKYRRIFDVFDCWFESGSMPWAQNGYPVNTLETGVSADFIAEGLDQTRGWFYTLNVLSVALFDKPSFKNVIVNGILLAEDGNKMSKRLKNYPEPMEVIEEFGADSVRLYMLNSPATSADDLRFSKRGVELTLRQILIPLWNAFHFYNTYATIYSFVPEEKEVQNPTLMDRWILSCLQTYIEKVSGALDGYDLPKGVEPNLKMIEQLTNWYIRRSRARFWQDEDNEDRKAAFQTLYFVLKTIAKVVAPFVPFLSERLFQHLKLGGDVESVHLSDFPKVDDQLRDGELEAQMDLVQSIVSLGHSLRKEQKIKVRQPLRSAFVICQDAQVLKRLKNHEAIIKDELNVKKLELIKDESEFVTLQAIPNFRVLGKKVGALMPKFKKAIESFSLDQIYAFMEKLSIDVEVDDVKMTLDNEDITIKRQVKPGCVANTDGKMTLALDIELDDALIEEGIARELVNKLNTLRKEQGFEVQDRIEVMMDASEKYSKSI